MSTSLFEAVGACAVDAQRVHNGAEQADDTSRLLVASLLLSVLVDVHTAARAGTNVSFEPIGMAAFVRRGLDLEHTSRIEVTARQEPLRANPFAPSTTSAGTAGSTNP